MLKSESIRYAFFEGLGTTQISEKLFAHISNIVFCIKDRDSRYVSANQCFATRLGLASTEEIIGKTAKDLFEENLAQSYEEQDNFVFASGRGITDRLELVIGDKQSFGWHLTSKIPLFDLDGEIHGLASTSQDLQHPRPEDISMAGLAKVTRYVAQHIDEPLRAAQLAKIADITPTQLERKMRRVYKLSTAQFIRKSRLEAAANLLLSTRLNLAAIAADCGYSDQSAFTRQFKHALGMTPGLYRNLYQDLP